METITPVKYFLYVRKSTDDKERQVRSIDDQNAELRELAKRKGLEVVREFEEKQTAKQPGRPVFNDMLARVERGEASGILAWHVDRLSRNSIDSGRLIFLIDSKVIRDLQIPTFHFEATAHGKFSLSMMFTQAKYYVDNLSENILRGQRQKLKNGLWPQQAPIGYLNDKKGKTIFIDPDKGPMIKEAFELYGTGNYTLEQVRNAMHERGLIGRRNKPLAVSNIQYLLRNPFYYGVIRYAGTYEGTHEPLISKSLFDRCQAVMSRKSKPKGPNLKPFLYRGVFRCGECGCFITTETQKGHNYLRCTKRVKKDCSQRFVREEQVAEQITRSIQMVTLPSEVADWMVAAIVCWAINRGAIR